MAWLKAGDTLSLPDHGEFTQASDHHERSRSLLSATDLENASKSEDEGGLYLTRRREERRLLSDDFFPSELRVYRRRWLVLVLVGLVVLEEGCVWNTWGPIALSAEQVYGWSDGNIALLANWGCMAYVVGSLPLSWVLDVKGIRKSVILAAALVTCATGLRAVAVAFASTTTAKTFLINIGHIFNGFSAPITFGVPSVLSVQWFPPQQRVTATALLAIGPYAGVAASFLLGPHIVPDRNCTLSETSLNSTNLTRTFSGAFLGHDSLSTDCLDFLSKRINYLLYGEFAFALSVLALILVALPTKPPNPPSMSSRLSRLSFVTGVKKLFKNHIYLVMAVVYGLTTGIYSGWGAVLSLILDRLEISQTEAGWIGFYATVAGAVGGLMMAWYADRYSRQLRRLILLLFTVSSAMFLWFAVFSEKGVRNKSVVYITNIIGGFSLNACIPLFYEMSVEVAYPIAEGVTTIVLSLLNNVFVIIFLYLLLVPGIGTQWMTWVLASCCLLALPALFVVQEVYTRFDIDTGRLMPSDKYSVLDEDGPATCDHKKRQSDPIDGTQSEVDEV